MNIATLVGVLLAAYGGAAWLLRREYASPSVSAVDEHLF
jgi:hypothetical protein